MLSTQIWIVMKQENGCSQLKIWIVMKQSINLELNEQCLGGYECEEHTHSQQQPQAPNAHEK